MTASKAQQGEQRPGNKGRKQTRAATMVELAAMCGVSKPTLYKYRVDPGFPKELKSGGWSVAAVLRFILRKRKERETVNGSHLDPVAKDLKERNMALQNQLLEARLARLTGQTILRADAEQEILFLGDFFSSSLDALPDRITAELRDPKALAVIQRKIAELKDDLSGQLEAMGQRIADEALSETETADG